MTYEQMADDVADLIGELGVGRADVCGFSMGAGIALQAAIRHRGSVRKLVFLSGVFKGDGEYAEVRAMVSTFAPDLPMLGMLRQAYVQAAGSPDGWPVLVENVRRLLGASYDWSSQVSALSAPVLIVAGDSDTFPVAHAVEMFKLLGGDTAAAVMGGNARGQLAVLPATNHFNFMARLELLVPLVSAFLDSAVTAPHPEST